MEAFDIVYSLESNKTFGGWGRKQTEELVARKWRQRKNKLKFVTREMTDFFKKHHFCS